MNADILREQIAALDEVLEKLRWTRTCLAAELDAAEQRASDTRTCFYPYPEQEHDHAMCEDAVRERAEDERQERVVDGGAS